MSRLTLVETRGGGGSILSTAMEKKRETTGSKVTKHAKTPRLPSLGTITTKGRESWVGVLVQTFGVRTCASSHHNTTVISSQSPPSFL